MSLEGRSAAAVIEFALGCGLLPGHALTLAGYQVVEVIPAQGGQSYITCWSPKEALITLRVAIAGWGERLMIEEIYR